MSAYPRLLYRGAADATAQTCLVDSDAALDLALSQGWRRRRVPDVVIDPDPPADPPPDTQYDITATPAIDHPGFALPPPLFHADAFRTLGEDLARSDYSGDPDLGNHASPIPETPASARPTKKKKPKPPRGEK